MNFAQLRGALATAAALVLALPAYAQTRPVPPDPRAIQLEREVERLVALYPNGALWPGLDPLAIPLAVYDGQKTYLFRHPSPPAGFTAVAGSDTKALVRDGRLEEITANTSAMIGGVSTATVMMTGSQQSASVELMAPVAIHEAFHVFQRARHKDWTANEADLFSYYFTVPGELTQRRAESEALRRALISYEPENSRCWIRAALKFRQDRFKVMDPKFSAYERGTEMNEGLATYVEARAAGRIVEMPASEFPMTDVRKRAYASGSAIATLLDRFLPDWKQGFERGDRVSMERALDEAAGEGKACTLPSTDYSALSTRSWEEHQKEWDNRGGRREAFMKKPGWSIVVDWAGGRDPLFAMGFDPLNVQRLGLDSFLHTRFLKLGNANGQIEFLNVESLTEAAGIHPIENGFKQVIATGLQKPVMSDSAGFVRIVAPGVAARFKDALVKVDGTALMVKLQSKPQ